MVIKYLEQCLVKIGLNLYFSFLPPSRKGGKRVREHRTPLCKHSNWAICWAISLDASDMSASEQRKHQNPWHLKTARSHRLFLWYLQCEHAPSRCNADAVDALSAFVLVDVAEPASASHKSWGARPRMQTGRAVAAAAAEMSEEAGELWQDLTEVSSIATGMERWVAESGQGRATRPRLFLWLTVRTWCLILASHQ